MQLDHFKKRKWLEDEKEFALSLYYISPKAYVFLRNTKKFALPCVTLIRKWINELQLTPGINPQVIDKIATKVKIINNFEKECVLMWDEMSIKTILQYNSRDDLIEGYQDLGELGRTSKFAKYALCFMLRGLKFSWKQPVAYFISNTNIHGHDLSVLITKVIKSVLDSGLILRSMVCDQGTTNQKAISLLSISEERPYFESGKHKIFFNYDVPHLIKSVRNNLLKQDFIVEEEIISWDVIRELREVERNNLCKAAPKLTDRHVNPNNFERMFVSLATQVFSATVSAALNTGHMTGDLKHPACLATATFINRMNNLFDCLNSHRAYDSNPYKSALSESQPQIESYLRESYSWLYINGIQFRVLYLLVLQDLDYQLIVY